MKKLIPILLAVFALVSCEKDPDMDKLDNEYLVFTSHDTSTKFNDFSTYYIPDSILIIGDKKDPEYWKDENAQTERRRRYFLRLGRQRSRRRYQLA